MRLPRTSHPLALNAHFLGLALVNQTMAPLVLPLLVQQFVGEAHKGATFGTLRLAGLMLALLTQSVVGILSDRCTHPWGRRRPFILGGALAAGGLFLATGLSAGLDAAVGLPVLTAAYIGLQIATNTSQAAAQGLIPDLIPLEQRNTYAGVKAFLEAPLPVILVALIFARWIAAGRLWVGLGGVLVMLALTTALTLLAPENPLAARPPADWQPVLRQAAMSGVFTALILALGKGVQIVGQYSSSAPSTTASPLILCLKMGAAGLLAMSLAVVGGVWSSIRLSLGQESAHTHPDFTGWVINRLAFLVGAFNLPGFALYFLQGRLGFTQAGAAAPASQLMLWVGGALLGTVALGSWLTNRVGQRQAVVGSGILAALGVALMLSTTTLLSVYAGGALVGAATGLFYVANWAWGTHIAQSEAAGRYLGLANLAGAGAGAIGAYIGGPLADFFTRATPHLPGLGYVVLFAVYGGMFLLSAVAASFTTACNSKQRPPEQFRRPDATIRAQRIG